MATSPGYQKREDGNVYYVIGGNTMRVHEVLYKKGSELVLNASEGTLNLKGRKVCINGTDITQLVSIMSSPDSSIATSKDIAAAIKTHTDNSKNSVNANVTKVPWVPNVKQISTSFNNLLAVLGKSGNIPTNGILDYDGDRGRASWENIAEIDVEDWNEAEIVETLNKLVKIVNAFFGR